MQLEISLHTFRRRPNDKLTYAFFEHTYTERAIIPAAPTIDTGRAVVHDGYAATVGDDLLDLLIQAMRYRRENPDMSRYTEFRNAVMKEKFKSDIGM